MGQSPLPSLTSLGEFGLINSISSLLGKKLGKEIIASIGDDAAVIKSTGRSALVFTTDALVEGVHFDLRHDKPYDIGWKSIVASLSDIAAMNAKPVCAVVSIAIPKKISSAWIFSLYKGISAAAKKYRCPIVGGDTTSSCSGIFISVALLGAADRKNITLRSSAKPGDLVCVTNDLGRAYAALKILQTADHKRTPPSVLLLKHAHPTPQFDILKKLRKASVNIHSMIDISDGLSAELNHIAKHSGVLIEIDEDSIPIHPSVMQYARILGEDATPWALQSGEEYELLFTASPQYRKKLSSISGITLIGEVKKGKGVLMRTRQGKRIKLSLTGYTHF
ncbi:MAG TPA: thiamine-phosphate kinase [Candidatus Kapabacteria bacterium]|nr:thiamine-phosphate kinase [Candidatus Kapabacteria bacterium]